MQRLTPAELHEFLLYDPITGVFTWAASSASNNGRVKGRVAGTYHKGYTQLSIHKVLYRAARVAWAMMTGEWPPDRIEVDHRDGDGQNNRWLNLRLTTHKQNMENRPLHRNSSTGIAGVNWSKQDHKFHAYVCENGKKIYVAHGGLLDCAAARISAQRRLYTHARDGN